MLTGRANQWRSLVVAGSRMCAQRWWFVRSGVIRADAGRVVPLAALAVLLLIVAFAAGSTSPSLR